MSQNPIIWSMSKNILTIGAPSPPLIRYKGLQQNPPFIVCPRKLPCMHMTADLKWQLRVTTVGQMVYSFLFLSLFFFCFALGFLWYSGDDLRYSTILVVISWLELIKDRIITCTYKCLYGHFVTIPVIQIKSYLIKTL